MTPHEPISSSNSFLTDFWRLCKPYWTSEEKWQARGLLAATTLLMLLTVWAGVQYNVFRKEFYDALATFNTQAVKAAILKYVMLVGLLVLAHGYMSYFNNLLSTRWRRWLTKTTLNRWLENSIHYHMQHSPYKVDNPDQRISEDLNSFPELTLSIISLFFHSIVALVTFGTILWDLTASVTLTIGSWHTPFYGYIFWSAMLYGLFGLLSMKWIARKLVNIDYFQQYFNADFRYSMIHLRENSEQIASYQGENKTNHALMKLFERIYQNSLEKITLQKKMTFLSTGFSNVALFIGLFVSIPIYLQKAVNLGGMMQISGTFAQVVDAFTSLVSNYAIFPNWRAVVTRLAGLEQAMTLAKQLPIAIPHHAANKIEIRQLTIALPDKHILIDNLNLTLVEGERLLITGPSGCGKSTLLRTLTGLWPHYSGLVYFPSHKKSMFLSQKSYLPIDTLKEALTYPNISNTHTDVMVLNALKLCGLQKLSSQLNVVRDWSKLLSLGEQQLLSFTRVLLQQPAILLLDESTSALDETMEAYIYTLIRTHLPKTIIISVGHRHSLHQLHDRTMALTMQHTTIVPVVKEAISNELIITPV